MTTHRAAIVLGAGAVCTLLLLPLDDWLMRGLGPFHGGLGSMLRGDVMREVEFVQQFGAFSCTVIAAVAVLLLDRAARPRLLDWAFGLLLNGACYNALKFGLGRPRPRVVFAESALPGYDSTLRWAFFWRQYPLPRPREGAAHLWAHSWDVFKGISSDLWSMPSSHTAAAFLLAAVLTRLYPALRPLVLALACIVGCARVLVGAHFPSDVVAGAALGWVVGALAMDHRWGSRLLRRAGQADGSPASETRPGRP